MFSDNMDFENLPLEEREKARAAKARRREGWSKTEDAQRFLVKSAGILAGLQENMEEAYLSKKGEADSAAKEVAMAAMRKNLGTMNEWYQAMEISSKYGFKIAEELFDLQTGVDGINADVEKRLKALLKKESEEGSSGGKKAKGAAGTEFKTGGETAGLGGIAEMQHQLQFGAMAVPGVIPAAASWGWGAVAPYMQPPMAAQQAWPGF